MDVETGLLNFRNRLYSPEQGRFVSRDPLGYVDGMGLHEAFGGNPGNRWDPWGLTSITVHTSPTLTEHFTSEGTRLIYSKWELTPSGFPNMLVKTDIDLSSARTTITYISPSGTFSQSTENVATQDIQRIASLLKEGLAVYQGALPKAKELAQWYQAELKAGRTHTESDDTTFAQKSGKAVGYTMPLPGAGTYVYVLQHPWLQGVYWDHENVHVKQWESLYGEYGSFLPAMQEWIATEYQREIEAYEETIKDLEERIKLLKSMLCLPMFNGYQKKE
jgi:hypothetical protein